MEESQLTPRFISISALGAKKVYAADMFEEKLELAMKMGADETVNVASKDLGSTIMQYTG